MGTLILIQTLILIFLLVSQYQCLNIHPAIWISRYWSWNLDIDLDINLNVFDVDLDINTQYQSCYLNVLILTLQSRYRDIDIWNPDGNLDINLDINLTVDVSISMSRYWSHSLDIKILIFILIDISPLISVLTHWNLSPYLHIYFGIFTALLRYLSLYLDGFIFLYLDISQHLSVQPSIFISLHLGIFLDVLTLSSTLVRAPPVPSPPGALLTPHPPGALTIQPEVFEATISKIVLHDGHEGGHLAEEQHLVVGGPELGQDPVQELELPRGTVQIQPGMDKNGHSERKTGIRGQKRGVSRLLGSSGCLRWGRLSLHP